MLPDTKGDTGGTASASATVCPRDRHHGQRQRYPRRGSPGRGPMWCACRRRGPTTTNAPACSARRRSPAREGALHGGALAHRMAALNASGRDAVVCGDWKPRAPPRTTSRTGAAMSRSPGFCPPNGSGSPSCSPRAGSTWFGSPTCPGRTPGGRGGDRADGAGLGLCAALVRPCSGDRRISVSGRSGESTRRNRAHRNSLG